MRTVLAAAFLAASAAALAQGSDIGLVNLVSGEVTCAPASGQAGKVQPFIRQAGQHSGRKVYERMRRQFSAHDITPELYLYSALHEYPLYDDERAARPRRAASTAHREWKEKQHVD